MEFLNVRFLGGLPFVENFRGFLQKNLFPLKLSDWDVPGSVLITPLMSDLL
jgi:hypothetical protein